MDLIKPNIMNVDSITRTVVKVEQGHTYLTLGTSPLCSCAFVI